MNRTDHSVAAAEWLAAYQRALGSSDAAGYYNRNTRIEVEGRPIIVRVPIRDAPEMDLRVLPETRVLRAVHHAGLAVPKVLYESADPAFAIHEYIAGDVLNDISPRGAALPPHVINDVIDAIVVLHQIERTQLPPMSSSWAPDGATIAIALTLLSHTQRIFDGALANFESTYRSLGVPDEPLAELRERLQRLHSRPFHLVHADIHRKNLIVTDGKTWLLDWELAIWGDPLYEIAVHLHKMKYRPDEERRFIEALLNSSAADSLCGCEDDLEVLLLHERAKSVIVDTIRYTNQIRHAATPPTAAIQSLCASLASKLVDVAPLWQNEPLGPDAVYDVLRHG